MIQLQAATRLKVMAAADEAKARAYLKSLGVDPKRKLWQKDADPRKDWKGEFIAFEIDSPEAALDAVAKHLGSPKQQTRLGIKQWSFKLSSEYRILISEKGFTRAPAYVELLDTTRNVGRDDSKMH